MLIRTSKDPVRRRLRWAVAGVVGTLSLVSVSAASAVTQTFTNPGESQFTVPSGVTSLNLDIIGGAGGDTERARGGKARRVQATIRVVPGEVLYVAVGGNGANGRKGDGAGGGGASGVRLCSVRTGVCPGSTDALQSRLAIAGGGGGAAGSVSDGGPDGGNGGDADNPGRDGQDSQASGGGAGTTTTGGKGGGRDRGQGSDGASDTGGRGGSARDRGSAGTGGAGGANGGGDGGAAGSDSEPGGGGAAGGYNGGGGGASGDGEDSGAGGAGGGASWVVSSATNAQMSYTSSRPSVTIIYTPAPTPPPPAPNVTGITPTSGPVTGGRTVTITGSGFDHARRVLFGATAAPRFALSGATRMTVVVPPAASASAVDVRVDGPGGLSALSPAARFTYTAQPTPRPRPTPTPRPRPSPAPRPRPGPAPTPTPAAECDVPNLVGLRLGQARKSLTRADCTVGKVRGPRRGRRVRVYRQSMGAGTHLMSNAAVDLWLRPTRRGR